MTRPCGCGGNSALTCNCVVQAGNSNVTVTGTGNAENPYRVSAQRAQLAVIDTGTIDHTLAGDGSAATPYSLSSRAVISGQASNALQAGSDGGLFVAAGASGALVTGCGLTGAGTGASPLRLSSPQTVQAFAAQGATLSYTSAQFCAGVSVTQATMVTLTNPSTCQSMIVDIQGGGRIRLEGKTAWTSAWADNVNFTLIRDGVDVGLLQTLQIGAATSSSDYYWVEHAAQAPVVLAPGASATWGVRFDAQLQGPCGVQSALVNLPALKVIGHLV